MLSVHISHVQLRTVFPNHKLSSGAAGVRHGFVQWVGINGGASSHYFLVGWIPLRIGLATRSFSLDIVLVSGAGQ